MPTVSFKFINPVDHGYKVTLNIRKSKNFSTIFNINVTITEANTL